jgi:Domain of unknown function (DUF389)
MGTRRIEIIVPHIYAAFVLDVIENPLQCNMGDGSEKPGVVTQIEGVKTSLFLLTVKGPDVGNVLDILRTNGIGVIIGTVVLTTLDCIKPQWGKGPKKKAAPTDMEEFKKQQDEEALTNAAAKQGKPLNASKLKDMSTFQKARLTTEEIYNNIFNGANMTTNTWFNLVGASTMAAGGATSNASVFIVAAMLVSPIMGPILGMTFGYRIADWELFALGFFNEIKMAITCFMVGLIVAIFIGSAGVDTYNWPTDVMMAKGQAFSLIVSIIVSAAAGSILGIGVTSGGVNALVGTGVFFSYVILYVNNIKMIKIMRFSYLNLDSHIGRLVAPLGQCWHAHSLRLLLRPS